jgi:cytochrome c-type biogenesis protein CcmH/NrfG
VRRCPYALDKDFSFGGFVMDSRKIVILVFAALFVGVMTGILAPKFFGARPDVARIPPGSGLPATQQAAGPDYSLQIDALKRRLQSKPNDVDLLVQLGNTYFDSNMYTQSIEAYEKALALKPGNPNVLTDLGVMYRRNGQPDEAVKRFREAASISPTHSQSRMNLGIVLFYDIGDVSGAREALLDFIDVVGNSAEADNARALLAEIDKSRRTQH